MKFYIISIIIIVAILLLIYMLIKLNKKIRIKAYEFFLEAEIKFSSGEGQYKMDYVMENIYDYLPAIAKIFISRETFKKIIQKMFNEVKDLLDDGKRNKSTKGSN